MKIEKVHIEHIRSSFAAMQSRDDLLKLLNYAKKLIYGKKAVLFELKQLTYYTMTVLPGIRLKETAKVIINNNTGELKLEETKDAKIETGYRENVRYTQFDIRKKSGSLRTIHAPKPGLKAIQKCLNLVLQVVYEDHQNKAATGFIRGKSIVDNARIHEGANYVFNIDLKDFFPSIDQARVWKCLQLKPFNLIDNESTLEAESKQIMTTGVRIFVTDHGERVFYKVEESTVIFIIDKAGNFKKFKERLTAHIPKPDINQSSITPEDLKLLNEYQSTVDNTIFEEAKKYILSPENIAQLKQLAQSRKKIANIIASLCCTEMEVERKNAAGEWEKVKKNVLPQGAPTSPVITNIVCQRLDFLLSAVARRFGLKYSRYADDITFSSPHNVYQKDGDFLKELYRIITEQGFHLNKSKTRLQKKGYRQVVTGLLVTERVNVQKRYIKQIRLWLYYWEKYGYERASAFFLQQYKADKGHIKKGKPNMTNVIAGKLDYLRMVKAADNELCLKLKARFEKLTGKAVNLSINLNELEESESNVTTTVIIVEKPIPVFHKPKELVALLRNFSKNDSALKYTTHSWDAGRDAIKFKDLSDFLVLAKSEFNKFGNKLKGLNEYLYWKIYNFLFNPEIAKTGWGDINPKKRIYFGWSSPELLEACKSDISLNPEDFIVPEKFQIQRSGKTLQKFKHIIDVFKNEIEVRDENSALLNLILQKHDQYLISFSAPKVSNLENKTFYTDIQWLGKALDLIFEGIQKYPQHPVVEYAVTESNNDRLVLTILHRNSFKNGLSIYDDKLNLKRGDFGTIKDKLRNLCDWCIESEFAEGAYRIHYLVSDNEIPAYEKIMSAEGFKHILTFYK